MSGNAVLLGFIITAGSLMAVLAICGSIMRNAKLENKRLCAREWGVHREMIALTEQVHKAIGIPRSDDDVPVE